MEAYSKDDVIQEEGLTHDYAWLQGEGVSKMARKVMT